jgi:hypothetical protein
MVPSPMVASKYPFRLRSRPQTPDSPPLPTVFYSTFCLCYVSSLRPYFVTSSSGTQDRPQPLSTQSLAHTFRHTWGGLPITPIFEFQFRVFIPSTVSGSSLLVALASRVKHKSFISNSYKKHGGYSQLLVARFHSARLRVHAGTPAIPFPSWVYFITRGYPGIVARNNFRLRPVYYARIGRRTPPTSDRAARIFREVLHEHGDPVARSSIRPARLG